MPIFNPLPPPSAKDTSVDRVFAWSDRQRFDAAGRERVVVVQDPPAKVRPTLAR